MVNLEVCLDSFASTTDVASAVQQGTNRIELCGYLAYGGGLTPSLGLLKRCKTVVDASRFMCMIRPRSGSFVYSESEVETMLADIAIFKKEGVQGVVFGCLTMQGEVDVSLSRRLAEAASPMQVTFHRAFDVTPDWRRAFDDIASIGGITRILTSGHEKNAIDGAAELVDLVTYAKDPSRPRKVDIIAAAGIDDTNIESLRQKVPELTEVHLTSSNLRLEEDGRTKEVERGVSFGFGAGEIFKMDGPALMRVWEIVRAW